MARNKDYDVTGEPSPIKQEAMDAMFRILFEELAALSSSSGGFSLPSAWASGSLLYGSSSTTAEALAIGAANRVLKTDGSTPSWGLVDLTANITGNLPVAHLNSGSGATSSTFWRGDGTWGTPVTDDTLGISGTQKEIAYNCAGGSIPGFGTQTSGNIQGTPTSGSYSDNQYTDFTTAAGAGAFAGFGHGGGYVDYVQTRHTGTFTLWMRTGSNISDVRIWLGLGQNNPTDSDTASNHWIGFRYSTVAGDGGWVGVTKGSGSQTVTSTVASIATSTRYKLVITFTDTTVSFSVNGSAVQTSTTNLPTSTVGMHPQLFIISQAAASKVWAFSRVTVRFGN